MAHAAPGRVGHLAILQMIASVRKRLVIAAVIVVKMADDDVADALGRDAERGEPVANRLGDLALAAGAHRLVETGVDDDRAGRPDDRPDEKIERLEYVVRVAVDEICRRAARVM